MANERTTPNTRAHIVQNSQRPVVIRPLQRVPGTDQSDRIDGPEGLRGPHKRTERLEEYVSWLQQRSQNELSGKSPAKSPGSQSDLAPQFLDIAPPKVAPPSSTPTSRPASTPQYTPAASPPISPLTTPVKPRELSGNWSFAQKNSVELPQKQQPPVNSKPIIEIVKPLSSDASFQRIDRPHSELNGPMARGEMAKPFVNDQQLEADLNRVLKKLESAEVRANDLGQQITNRRAAVESPSARILNTPVSANPPRRSVAPAEFMQPYPEFDLPVETSSSLDGSLQVSLSREEIIQTISSAIASVLTDQTDSMIELKVKQQLNELKRKILPQNVKSDQASGFGPTAEMNLNSQVQESVVQFEPKFDAEAASNEAHQQGRANRTEIPITVAAWDVEDFQWPSISDQMVTVGGKAIEALSATVKKTLRGTRRRIGVTAPERQSGNTSIAISLARWAAAEGERVLLVDADLTKPELSSLVGLGKGISWLDAVLEGGQNPAELIIRSRRFPICIMPLFPLAVRQPIPEKLFDYLGKLIDPVAFDFDLIVIDLGPSQQIANELSHGNSLIDTALIVHQDRDFAVKNVQSQLRSLDVEQFVFAQNSVRSQTRSHVA